MTQTAIDTVVAAFLGFCLAGPPIVDRIQGEPYTVTVYHCPLIKSEGVFFLYTHICPDPEEHHAVALLQPDGRVWALNQFGGVDVAYMELRTMPVYRPACQVDPPLAHAVR